jgi:flagellar operon protein
VTPDKVSTRVPEGKGPSFQETLDKVGSTPAQSNLNSITDGVKFSNHAVERMVSRGIRFSPDQMGKLNEAIDRAASKGSKDTLVLMNDAALIVSVKNKTVVTVMDKSALKENVFTNIDSTIVM